MSVGLLLAAGEGRRMGAPKALVSCVDGVPWVRLAVDALQQGGCDDVVVTVGARASEVAELVTRAGAQPVVVPDWEDGMARSLAAGLQYVADLTHDAALIHLVDLPDVGGQVIARLLGHAHPQVVARARFGTHAGHPVLIGREHWQPLTKHLETAQDHGRGARDYLRIHGATLVDCSDLAAGADVDAPYQHCPRCGTTSHIVRPRNFKQIHL